MPKITPTTPLREARLKANMTQRELASRVGVQHSRISHLEVGHYKSVLPPVASGRVGKPPGTHLPRRIAEVLGVPVESLFPDAYQRVG